MDQNKSKPPQPKKKKKSFTLFSTIKTLSSRNRKPKRKKFEKSQKQKKALSSTVLQEKKVRLNKKFQKTNLYSAGYDGNGNGNGNGMGIGFSANQMLCIYHRERETSVVVLIRSCELVLGLTNKKQKKRHGLRQDNNVKFLFCCKK